jgi:hypothetical protein
MGAWTLAEKIIAGLAVALIVGIVTMVLLPRWRRRRRLIVNREGNTCETFVSAELGGDNRPDILVRNGR